MKKLSRLSTKKRIVKNFLSLTVANILSQAVGFISIVYLARTINARGLGQISFASAIIAFFQLISNLGLSTTGIRGVARNKEQTKEYVNNILSLRIILAIISSVMLLIFLLFIKKSKEYKLLIALYGLTLFPSVLSLNWLFNGIERMEFVGIGNIIERIVYIGLLFLFIKNPTDIIKVPIFLLLASLVMSSLLIFIFIKNYGWISLSFNVKTWKALLSESLPMAGSSIMITIYYKLDTIMLGLMKEDDVVGCYNAAYKVNYFFLTLLGIFFQTLYPVVSYRHKHRRDDLRGNLCLIMRNVILITTPIVFGGMAIADKLLPLLFGIEFSKGSLAFKILIWNLLIVAINGVYAQLILLMGEGEKDVFIGTIIGAVTNTILNFIMIPKLSLYGAAIATIITQISITIYVYWACLKTIKVEWTRFIYKPLIASTGMFLVLFKLNFLNLFVLLPIGITIYTALILLLKGITKEDLLFLRRLS